MMQPPLQYTRRAAVIRSVAAVTSATAAMKSADALSIDDDKLPWIDAHSHIWPGDERHFKLAPGISLDDLEPSSFTDKQLMAIAEPHGVGRVVLIQHNVFHGFDNSYLIDAWRRHPDRFRVVGMVDDLRPHAGKAMRSLLTQGVTGFRIRPRKGIVDWLQTDGMIDMWTTAAETRQSMCCLINPSDLPAVDAACERHPDTPVVIDHYARIGIDGDVRKADLDQLCRLARHQYTRVKVSAFYALGKKQPPHTELLPMIKRLCDSFGPERLMWASDCPYQMSGANTYESSIALIRQQTDNLSPAERRQLLRTTAEKTFFQA